MNFSLHLPSLTPFPQANFPLMTHQQLSKAKRDGYIGKKQYTLATVNLSLFLPSQTHFPFDKKPTVTVVYNKKEWIIQPVRSQTPFL